VAEAIHSFCSYLEANPGRRPERFHQLTHGAGFLEILRTRVVVGPAVTRQVGS
jgi:predicted ATPase